MLHGLDIVVDRYNQTASSDRYADPLTTPTTSTVKMLFTGLELDEEAIIAGGKVKESLHMIGQPGTVKENDIIHYNSHVYDVRQVCQAIMGGANELEAYIAIREVDI